MGFVCPEWAKEFWRADNCQLLGRGPFHLVDMDLQTTIFTGTTQEVHTFLMPQSTRSDRSSIFGLDLEDLESCP